MSSKSIEKVLVTGANGHIGQHVVRAVIASGRQAVAFVRELFGSGSLFGIEIMKLKSNGGWYVHDGMLLLPASAFFLIGLLIFALRSWKPDQIEND